MNAPKYLHEALLDSRRFGISVQRGTIEPGAHSIDILDEIANSAADLIILRVPAGSTEIPIRLQLKGNVLIHADTLVYYAMELSPNAAPPAEPKVERATEMHRDAIAAIAERSFANYRAHYAANPLLPKDLVLSGYVEWAMSRLYSDGNDTATWVVMDEEIVAGFATCDVQDESVEIVLNAVHPDFERRGLYGMLLRQIQHHYSHQLLKQLLISTQIWNFTVQRQWARNGLRLQKAYDTYHLDRRLIPAAGKR